jgi:hypothetical protein
MKDTLQSWWYSLIIYVCSSLDVFQRTVISLTLEACTYSVAANGAEKVNLAFP